MAVLFQTTVGELAVDLFTEDTPYSAYNFLKLCKAKYYNNVAFHRVEKNFLASAGAPLTADARWNVAGLGGVSADFLTLGRNNNLVTTGETDPKDVELRGGCSFWGVEALAAGNRVTLRRLTRRPPGAAQQVKKEEEEDEEDEEEKEEEGTGCPSRESRSRETNPVASPSGVSSSRNRPRSSPPAVIGDRPSSSASGGGPADSSTPLSSSSFAPACSTVSSSSSSSSGSSQRRKSSVRKSGWDVVDSSSTSASESSSCSQLTSYFSSLDFSSLSFPPFPSNPLPHVSSFSVRPPLRTPSSARFCPAEPSLQTDMTRKHKAKGMVGWIPSVIAGTSMFQQQLGTLSAEQQRRLHGEITSLFYVTLREDIDFLDKRNLTLFGRVTEGLDVLEKINHTFVDERFVPLTVRVAHKEQQARRQGDCVCAETADRRR